MNQPTAPSGKIFVTFTSRRNDEIETKSGIKFYQDTSFRPEWHTVITGDVVSVPMRVGEQIENAGITPEVRVGDKLYFDWSVMHDKENIVEIDGKDYALVEYFQAICVVRDGEIIPVGGRALIEPYEHNRGDKFEGSTLYLPECMKVEKREDIGVLRHIGSPKEGQPVLSLESGDLVFIPDFTANKNNIEGVDYYVVEQEYIQAKVNSI